MNAELESLKRDLVAALDGKRWAEALPLLEAWCERFPEHARSWLNRGCCLVQLGRFTEAVAAFDRCLELEPGSAPAAEWRRRALAALEQSRTVSAPAGTATATAAAAFALGEVTRRVPPASQSSQASRSFATMAIPDSRRGWQAGTLVDGRYEVQRTARGGMAVVAIAWDRELQRMVAVKTPLPSVLASADGRARFQREAESWIALGLHPNICCAHYLQEIGGMPRLFIEYVDGGDLNAWLQREPGPTTAERLDLAIQVASGLAYTHGFAWTADDGSEHHGLVHRDIKPANVLVSTDGVARVTDFGLVRAQAGAEATGGDLRAELPRALPQGGRPQDSFATGSWQTVTEAGGLVGTPPYMAPELWRQAQRGTVASDVYAFGCLLYELFCGRRPFVLDAGAASQTREAHIGGLMRLHLREPPPDPRALAAGVDDGLAALMLACLAKKPEDRPAGFAEVRAQLLAAYEGAAGRPYPRPEPRHTQLLADSLCNRGASFATLGLADRAAASFREALAVDPRHLEASFNAGLLGWRREGLGDAELERRLGEAVRAAADPARAALLEAQLRLLLDDPRGALAALAVAGDDLAARRARGLAELAALRGKAAAAAAARARELLEAAAAENPSDLEVVLGLAEACALAGDAGAAAEILAAARALDHELPQTTAAAALRLPGHRPLRRLEHPAPAQCLRVAEDGRVVVGTGEGEAVVWGPAGERPLARFDLDGEARPGRSLALLGEKLVACCEGGPLALFALGDGRRLRAFRTHPGVATCVEAAPDGSAVASGGSDRCVRLWSVASGECEATLAGHEAFISALAWHPAGRRLVSASADGTARVWDLGGARTLHVLQGHRGGLRDLALADEGRLLLSAGEDGAVVVWDLASGELLRRLRGHHGAVTAVAAVGQTVAAGGEDGTLRLWRLGDGETQRVLRLGAAVHGLAAMADGTRLLAAHGSAVSELPLAPAARLPWALAGSAASSELAERERAFESQLALARAEVAAGRLQGAIAPLAAARALPGYEHHREALELWSAVLAHLPKREPRAVVELRRLEGGAALTACALSPDGRTCFAADAGGGLRAVAGADGTELFAAAAHAGAVAALAISADGELVATAGRDGTLRVWRAADGARELELGGREGSLRALAFAPRDGAIVAAGDDGAVRLWRLEATARPELLWTATDPVSALALTADERHLLAAGWDGQVTVWDLGARAELRRLAGDQGPIHGLAASPDGRFAATAGEDGSARLWEIGGGRLLRTLSGHDGAVRAVAFTPDGRSLLTAGEDGTLRLWDLRSGAQRQVVSGHAGAVAAVAMGGDGSSALSAGADGSLRLWFIDWEPEVPESGGWDDRVRPFLEVFLRRREDAQGGGGLPTWSEQDLAALLGDLARRGFGWLAPERIERELERLAGQRESRRGEEEARARSLAARRARQRRTAPLREVLDGLRRGAGLRAAAATAAAVVVLALLWSLRSPGGEVGFSRLHRDLAQATEARGMRLATGTVQAFQSRPAVGTVICGEEVFEELVALVLGAERFLPPPADPGVPAELGFQQRYANAVACVGRLGDATLVEPILKRAGAGLHPKRLEDLAGVLLRVGDARSPRLVQALGDRSPDVRHLAALVLVFGDGGVGVPQLLAALDGDDPRALEAASSVLTELLCTGAVREEEAFERVRGLCGSIDPEVRRHAVRALVLFEEQEPARELLAAALADADPSVAAAAREVRETLEAAR